MRFALDNSLIPEKQQKLMNLMLDKKTINLWKHCSTHCFNSNNEIRRDEICKQMDIHMAQVSKVDHDYQSLVRDLSDRNCLIF